MLEASHTHSRASFVNLDVLERFVLGAEANVVHEHGLAKGKAKKNRAKKKADKQREGLDVDIQDVLERFVLGAEANVDHKHRLQREKERRTTENG